MNKSAPKVSVVMAVYNGANYVAGAIESILSQTFRDFEFVIVNDCSEDGTLKVIRSYKDGRIIVFTNKKNLGQTKSLNVGIRQARGSYIARIDADDFSYPKRLEKQLEFFRQNPDFDVCGASGHILNEDGMVRGERKIPTDEMEIFCRIFFESPIIHISALMKRDKLLMLGGYDESFTMAQDGDLWSRFLIHKSRIGNVRDILVAYRIHSGSISRRDGCDKVIAETSEILYRNICAFTTLTINRDAAHLLRRVLISPVPAELDYKECVDMVELFLRIFSNLKPKYQMHIDEKIKRRAMGRFQHNIGMAMLRKNNLNAARKMLLDSIKNRYPSTLPYAGYFLTFLHPFAREKILSHRKNVINRG